VLDVVNAKTTFAVSAAVNLIILERLAMNTKDIEKCLSVSTAMKKSAKMLTIQRGKMSVRQLLVLR
jgi:hypothetical protein